LKSKIIIIAALLLANLVFGKEIAKDGKAWDKAPRFKAAVYNPVKDAYFTEDFEGTFPAEGWVLDPESGTGVWAQDDGTTHGPGSVFEGSKAAMFNNYDYSGGAEGSIITSAFDVSTAETPMVKFHWWNNDGAYTPAGLKVLTSVDGATFIEIDSIATYGSGEENWMEYNKIIAKDVTHIKLTGVSDYGSKNTFVDMLTIEEAPTTPIASINLENNSFDEVTVGDTKSTGDVFNLTNTGGGSLAISGITDLSGTDFTTNLDTSVELVMGESYSFGFTYAPTAAEFDTAYFEITTNAGVVGIGLSGNGFVLPEDAVEIGNGEEKDKNLPIEGIFAYNYTQSLFLQEEINISDKKIEKLYYHYMDNDVSSVYTDDIVIYMGHTSADTLSGWLPLAEMTEVYNGSFTTLEQNGWIEITLDAPFAYNNSDNMVIGIDENTAGHTNNYDFFCTESDNSMSVVFNSDTQNPDPLHPPYVTGQWGFASLSKFRPNVRLQFVEPINTDDAAPEMVSFDGNSVNAGEEMNLTLVVSDETGVVSPVIGTYTIDGSEHTVEMENAKDEFTFNGTIPAQDEACTVTINFAVKDSSPAENTANLQAEIEWLAVNMDAPENLTATVEEADVTLRWTMPIVYSDGVTESFEGNFPGTDWYVNTTCADRTWEQVGTINYDDGTSVVPPDGVNQVVVGWANDHQDEWLITPAFSCEETSELTFDTFAHYGSTRGDHYYVKISTDGGVSWTELWDASTLAEADNAYDEAVTIDLSAYAGNDIKLAWNAVDGDGAGIWYNWILDNIVITSGGKAVKFAGSELNKVSKAVKKEVTITSLKTKNNRFSKHEDYVLVPSKRIRTFTGFKVFRNDEAVANIEDASVRSYTDGNLAEGDYSYYVKAVYTIGESDVSESVNVHIDLSNPDEVWYEYGSEWKGFISVDGTSPYHIAADFDLGTEHNWNAKVIVTVTKAAMDVDWKIVTFNDAPEDQNVIGSLSGQMATVPYDEDGLHESRVDITDGTNLSGKIAVVLDLPFFENGADSTMTNSVLYDGTSDIEEHAWLLGGNLPCWAAADIIGIKAWYLKLLVSKSNGVEEVVPGTTELHQNYPNPFNPSTTIKFFNNMSGNVKLSVYNVKGELVSTLVDGHMKASHHAVNFNASNLNSGVYYYTLEAPTKTITKKMIMVK